MEPNRRHHPLPGRLDIEIFDSFGEEDSIVDRLLALPVVSQARDDKRNVWDAGVARSLEKRVADQMRERLEGDRRPE